MQGFFFFYFHGRTSQVKDVKVTTLFSFSAQLMQPPTDREMQDFSQSQLMDQGSMHNSGIDIPKRKDKEDLTESSEVRLSHTNTKTLSNLTLWFWLFSPFTIWNTSPSGQLVAKYFSLNREHITLLITFSNCFLMLPILSDMILFRGKLQINHL